MNGFTPEMWRKFSTCAAGHEFAFSTKGAAFRSAWAAPQDFEEPRKIALKTRFKSRRPAGESRFQRWSILSVGSWGVAHRPSLKRTFGAQFNMRAAAYAYSNVVPRGRAMNRPVPSGSSSP